MCVWCVAVDIVGGMVVSRIAMRAGMPADRWAGGSPEAFRFGHGCVRTVLVRKDGEVLDHNSFASRIASATSRMDFRAFIESFWILRNASASLRPWVSIRRPFARSTTFRVSSDS